MATILIVEDEAPLRELLATILCEDGYRVLQAEHGAQALELIEQERPHLVISDIMMPVLDGAELCRRLKAREDTRDIPVILMSAAGPRVAGAVAADAFLAKPFDLAKVEDLVQRLLSHGTLGPAPPVPRTCGET